MRFGQTASVQAWEGGADNCGKAALLSWRAAAPGGGHGGDTLSLSLAGCWLRVVENYRLSLIYELFITLEKC